MAATEAGPMNRLKFRSKEDLLEGQAKVRLKREYGRGVYVNDIKERSDGDLLVYLGNTIPKDVSDRRERDRVLKFINIRDIYTMVAESTGEGYYIIELPSRDKVYDGFVEQRTRIINKLDYTMARVIYEDVFELTPVRNQLNSIIQIVDWILEEEPLAAARIDSIQNTDNTYRYLDVLEELSFLEVNDGMVSMGDKMKGGDLIDLDRDEFVKTVVGNIVKDGYTILQDQLDLWMLGHYPKFSNAYYYPALQREDPDLWLDTKAIQENLKEQYGESHDTLFIKSKLRDLSKAEVLEKDGEYVSAMPSVYNQVARSVSVV